MTDNTQELESLLSKCKTKDTNDFPDLKDGERCYSCQLWDAITAYTNKQIEEVLDRLENQALELPLSNGREMNLVDISAIEAERNKLKESKE